MAKSTTCGDRSRDLEIGGVEAGGTAETKLVVTKPRMVCLINIAAVIYAVVVILNVIYNVYVFFKTEVTSLEVLAWCVVQLPLCLGPLCLVPFLRKIFIDYAMGPSDSSSSSSSGIQNTRSVYHLKT